ncbi:Zn-ribbon domain-containing OB-fold protein [Nocardia anaemiae]|uniref:Zn-ribbon domain-containing OB-fold protein n=1 Tax=Nocardia anaemiae TaxID=263910 RepID=UPI000AF653F4|nr:OB-fold domain-containing protein [Nocardia anaemiae]
MSEHRYESSNHKPVGTENTMMIRRCGPCNKLFPPLTAECSSCRSWDLEWSPSSGLGSVVSWRLVHRNVGRPHAQVVPLTIAIVELDEGPWVYATIEGDVTPISDQPVRVRFEPHPRVDRFPVFTVCPTESDSDGDVTPAPQHRNVSIEVRSTHRREVEHRFDAWWVRTSLRQCELMASSKALDTAAKSLITFAIRWAPFGGATAAELLVTFGATRRRFLQMLDEALAPRRTDSVSVRGQKRQLKDALAQAWQMSPTAVPAGRA